MANEYQHFERACGLFKQLFLELRRVHFGHLVLTITPQSRAQWKGIHATDDNKIRMFITNSREKSAQSRHAHDTIAMRALKDIEHEVVRSYGGSHDALTAMPEITRRIFDSLVSSNNDIGEAAGQIQPDKWTVVKHDSDNNDEVNPKDVDEKHGLLKITFDGRDYAVDPAGAECGNSKTVSPWEEFVDTFPREKDLRAWPFGSFQRKFKKMRAHANAPRWEAEMQHREAVAEVMEMAIERWETGHMSVGQLFRSSADVYEREVVSLKDSVHTAVEAYVQMQSRKVLNISEE